MICLEVFFSCEGIPKESRTSEEDKQKDGGGGGGKKKYAKLGFLCVRACLFEALRGKAPG